MFCPVVGCKAYFSIQQPWIAAVSLKYFTFSYLPPFFVFFTVDLNVPDHASSIGGPFHPDLVAFAGQFFVFAPFDFGFRKTGQQPFPQVGGGFFAVARLIRVC
ncbi:MAG: hypothetical protein J7L95_05040 [Prolixibacteraceae bacterium]|nr:hypothetical protein [Prolixibacteraceae bacterium]